MLIFLLTPLPLSNVLVLSIHSFINSSNNLHSCLSPSKKYNCEISLSRQSLARPVIGSVLYIHPCCDLCTEIHHAYDSNHLFAFSPLLSPSPHSWGPIVPILWKETHSPSRSLFFQHHGPIHPLQPHYQRLPHHIPAPRRKLWSHSLPWTKFSPCSWCRRVA